MIVITCHNDEQSNKRSSVFLPFCCFDFEVRDAHKGVDSLMQSAAEALNVATQSAETETIAYASYAFDRISSRF